MSKSSIKILKKNLIYENQFGQLFDDDVLFLPQKIHGKYVRWKWKYKYSVAILPLTKNGEVVLLENFRHAARKTIFEIPKGFGEKHITPEDMASKELQEEAGLSSNQWVYKGEFFGETSFTYQPIKLFFAYECENVGAASEFSEVIVSKHKISLQDIPYSIKELPIVDSITLISLFMYYYMGV